jgi:hypothetical protein
MIDTTLRDRFHHVLRTVVSERPSIYLPFARRKYPGPSPEVISDETEFVIDGYTRCASTFAVYAFQLAQPRPVRMAHHLHAPAQLIAAARAKIPTLVLIRDPAGVVLSQVIREPGVSIRDALFSYTRFYDKLERYRSSYVVADFEETTTAFGQVVRRVNERFGTSYAEFDHTEENVARCVELIKERPKLSPYLLGFESGTVTLEQAKKALAETESIPEEAQRAWVPSSGRSSEKDALRAHWLDPRFEPARRRAYDVYHRFLQVRDPASAGDGAVTVSATL